MFRNLIPPVSYGTLRSFDLSKQDQKIAACRSFYRGKELQGHRVAQIEHDS